MSALEITDLRIAFADESKPGEFLPDVVQGVSLSVEAGSCVALVGESGSGKSMTARSVMQLLPQGARVTGGKVLVEGTDVTAMTAGDLCRFRGKTAAMVFQDPLASLNPLHRVGDQIAEAIRTHAKKKLSKAELRSAVCDLMRSVKLDAPEEQYEAYPHELSGGQRQRIVIAMAIANNPAVLIADEPTTALDANVQKGIIDLLMHLCRERGIAVLLISHDIALVREVADVMHIMQKGRIIETITDKEQTPEHPYSRLLMKALEDDWAEDQAQSEWARGLHEGTLAKPLAVRDLTVSYVRGGRGFFSRARPFVAVHPVSFELNQGECLGIIGESGSGKSSLASAVLRLIPSAGAITLDGVRLDALPQKALRPARARMQVVFQNPYTSLDPRMNVADIVAEGLLVTGKKRDAADTRKAVTEVLRDVGLDATYLSRFAHELSGGQRQRVAIARALVMKPKVLVLDEPTSSLDRALQYQLIALLKRLQSERDLSCIYISHDLSLIKSFAHRIMVMKDGHCIEQGFTREVFQSPKTDYLKLLLRMSFGEN